MGSFLHGAMSVVLLAPTVLIAVLGVPSLLRRPLNEAWTVTCTRFCTSAAFLAAIAALLMQLSSGAEPSVLSLGEWFSPGARGFDLALVVDGLSLVFVSLSAGICAVVAAFSSRYLHREPGFNRYFVQFALFVQGITLVALAGSIEVLLVGWELLGLSSALLVGFFHERRAAVRNALRLFSVYRTSDAAMLSAAVLLHHWAGSGSLSALFFRRSTADLTLRPVQALVVSALLIAAVAGKSALLPFSGWLPRAMEGPTPSSAVYYGALSIHAGCFLLLRVEPLLAQSMLAQGLAALAGGTTTIYATITARVQTDVKSALAYSALTQVGIIVVEIAVGLTSFAFVHMIGHMCFRILQFLVAPNILHDLHALEDRLEGRVATTRGALPRVVAKPSWFYLAALERGFVDALVDRCVFEPIQTLMRWLDRGDRMLCGSRATRERPVRTETR